MRSEMTNRAKAQGYAKKLGVKNIKYNLNNSASNYTYKDNTGYQIEPTRRTKK